MDVPENASEKASLTLAKESSNSGNTKLQLGKDFYIYGLILFIASILVTGYSVYVENQALQIPLIHWINNPSLYPNDSFAKTLPFYASTLWYLVAFLSRIIPLEPLLFSLFCLERLLVIGSAGYLAKTFAPQSKLAVVGAMSLFALGLAGPTLGGNELVINYFEQTGLSIVFLLLAFAAFYQRNPWLVAVWMALGFNCNIMFGVYALTYLAAVFFLDIHYLRDWKKWLLAFGLFLLLAFPVILITLSAFGQGETDKELWYLVSQVRFPHHLFPLTWNKIEFGKYFVLIFLVLGFLKQNRQKFESLFNHCKIWAGVSFLWLIYGFFAAYIAKSPSMLVMHPGRALTLWYGIAAVALVSVLAVKLETTRGSLRRSFIVALFSASFLIWYPIIGPYILGALLLALGVQPVWYFLFDNGNSRRIAVILTLGVVLLGIGNLQGRWMKGQSLASALFYRPPANLEEIALWAKENTPIDAVFLVDFGLGWQQFRAQSQRPVFMNWKDGSAILWDRPFVEPWVERLEAVGFDIKEKGLTLGKAVSKLNKTYDQLQDSDIKKLQARYPLNYWVVPLEHPSNLPIVFQNQSFKILRL